MALLKPDKTFDLGGVTVNEYLLTSHNPNKISMPTYPLTTVAGITVHNTDRIKDDKLAAGTTQAEQYTRATVNGNMGSVRVHFYVDENGAWQNLPFTLSGWHAADNKNGVTGPGNGTTIAIECIMSGDTSDKRNAKAEENCAKLVAALLKKYGYGTDHLFTHTYWLNKRDGRTGTLDHMNTAIHPYKWCPAYILPHWSDFVTKVKSYLDPAAATPSTPTTSDSPKSGTNTGASKQTVRKGDKGAAIKELQTKLAAKGYLRKTEIDGDFGKITLGALLAYQFENSLEVDGVCGPKTWASLLK